MTVNDYAETLSRGELKFVEEGYYVNRKGQTGYRAIYQGSQAYFWYSVSGTEVRIAPDEIAQALISPRRQILRENPYFNSNVQQGFEATVRAGEHWFMLGAAPDAPGF